MTDAGRHFTPDRLFSNATFSNPYILLLFYFGRFLEGFGPKYARGYSSGQAICGISNLQLPYVITMAGFFTGGQFINHFILPLLF
tara:strand:+ start:816 stop:1070 length:255 start_codon:yes stop_codon:yes gene_type:complete